MTDREQQEAVAALLGVALQPRQVDLDDLWLAREVEECLDGPARAAYASELDNLATVDWLFDEAGMNWAALFSVLHAPARTKFHALLKVAGKWKD